MHVRVWGWRGLDLTWENELVAGVGAERYLMLYYFLATVIYYANNIWIHGYWCRKTL